jgi:hypothetical protein
LPRFFTDRELEPQPFGTFESTKLVVFMSSASPEVLGNVQPLLNDPGTYHVWPRDGLCFEWNRTESALGNRFSAGRLYYERQRAGWPEIEGPLTKHFSATVSWIKRSYPLCEQRKRPIYVGPALSHAIRNEAAVLCWRGNGAVIPVIANKSCAVKVKARDPA